MAYHEAFWVVAGTTAPVFMIANIVAAGQGGQDLLDALNSLPSGAWPIREVRRVLKAPRRAAAVLIVNVGALFLAMTSLADEHDNLRPDFGLTVVLAGTLLTFWVATEAATAKARLRLAVLQASRPSTERRRPSPRPRLPSE